MIDDKFRELKQYANHDVEEEKRLKALSTYDYHFHLESLQQQNKRQEDAIQKQKAQGNRKKTWG